jgi:hypothetical protein
MGIVSRRPRNWLPSLITVLLTALAACKDTKSSLPQRPTRLPETAEGTDARAVRAALRARTRSSSTPTRARSHTRY